MKSKLQRELKNAWKELVASIPEIAPGCEIRPTDPKSCYKLNEESSGITFDFPMIGLRLRRLAGDDKPNLYVSVSGSLTFKREQKTGKPLVHQFSTRVSYYFVTRANLVDHILGVHYDCDPQRIAHPIYHAQLTAKAEVLGDEIDQLNEMFGVNLKLDKNAMALAAPASKIRIPTAHMDIMSVFVQLVADHLINSNSASEALTAFERTRDRLLFFKSDPDRDGRMRDVTANDCFRGPRWYPVAEFTANEAVSVSKK